MRRNGTSGAASNGASGAGGGAGSNVTVIRKTTNETVNNSTTAQQDDELNGINLVVGAEYVIEAELIFSPVTNTMGIKADFILASGAWDQRSWTATCIPNDASGGPAGYANGAFKTIIAEGGSLANLGLELGVLAGVAVAGLVISRILFRVMPGGR